MNSKLSGITDWSERAGTAHYGVKQLAADCDVSKRQLQRFIGEAFGLAPGRWMRELRLNRALALLSKIKNVKQVAMALGYSQACHFSRDFKSFFGFSPSQVYRTAA